MQKVDLNDVRDFYNSTPAIWAPNDLWHQWSYRQINRFLSQKKFRQSEKIMNAGSGGNAYGIECDMTHVDIADEKLKGIPNAVVASIEATPFPDETFDRIICVGSVINYCDAGKVIHESQRVLKTDGELYLEFESSWGYEYRGKPPYGASAQVVTVQFQGSNHVQWLYSLPYITSLIEAISFKVTDVYAYHIFSALALNLLKDESKAVKYAKYDKVGRKLPWAAKHANNFILTCVKS